MRLFKFILLTLLVIGTLNSCTYEDGPQLSLRSKKSRLMGKWLRESPEVMAGSSVFTEFKDDNKMAGGGTYTDLNGEVQAYSSDGEWEWLDDKKQVKIIWGPVDFNVLTIRRLTNSEFWFMYDGDDIVYKYRKEGK